jgi:hypothetical protein
MNCVVATVVTGTMHSDYDTCSSLSTIYFRDLTARSAPPPREPKRITIIGSGININMLPHEGESQEENFIYIFTSN